MEENMILKMMNTNNGDVLIDSIEQLTKVGITSNYGDNVSVICPDESLTERKREDVLYDILSIYNLSTPPKILHVFNLVIGNRSDGRKEYRTVLFHGPGFLMNNVGFTMENYGEAE